MGHYTNEIIRNAEKITQLKSCIDETVKYRDKNEHKKKEWQKACAEFHEQYDSLAFPSGLDGAYERILAGEPKAMEAAICFLECRPFFFRSGYMYKDILRKSKKAPFNESQKIRLQKVIEAYNEYKQQKTPNKSVKQTD